MKIKGVVVDAMIKEEVLKISPSIIWDDYYNGINFDSFDEFNDTLLEREKILNSITNKYMSGQDDAKWFWFSNCKEGIDAIKNIFPEFKIIEITDAERDYYPMDYDYLRDN